MSSFDKVFVSIGLVVLMAMPLFAPWWVAAVWWGVFIVALVYEWTRRSNRDFHVLKFPNQRVPHNLIEAAMLVRKAVSLPSNFWDVDEYEDDDTPLYFSGLVCAQYPQKSEELQGAAQEVLALLKKYGISATDPLWYERAVPFQSSDLKAAMLQLADQWEERAEASGLLKADCAQYLNDECVRM